MLIDLQRLIERAYGIEPVPDVRTFLLSDPAVAEALAPMSSTAREALLVRQQGEDLELSLYLDPADLQELSGEQPGLDCLMRAVEGISHFVLLVWRARRGRPVSLLELELQAEVDKFVVGCLAQVGTAEELVDTLFARARLRDNLTEEERRRYTAASELARTYCRALPDLGSHEFLRDLRRFWRFGQPGKVSHIARLAA